MFNSNPVMALMLPLLIWRLCFLCCWNEAAEDLALSLALNRDGFLR